MHSSKNKLLSYQCLPIGKDMAPSLVPTTFMIKPRQILNYFLSGVYFIPPQNFFHSLWAVFSFPVRAWGIFYSCQGNFYSLPGAFHSTPRKFFIPCLGAFSFLPGTFFICCLGAFSFLPRNFFIPVSHPYVICNLI